MLSTVRLHIPVSWTTRFREQVRNGDFSGETNETNNTLSNSSLNRGCSLAGREAISAERDRNAV